MRDINRPMRILFLCTGNSCRSQMAEGWARHLKGHLMEVGSAGVLAKGVDPRAVSVMSEAGVDISNQHSNLVTDFEGTSFDCMITLCQNARETCPSISPQTKVVHFGFDDPPKLAERAESDETALPHYRRVRDEIRAFVETLPQVLR